MKNVLGGIAGGVFVGIGVPIIFGLLRVPDFDLGWTETLAAALGIVPVWYATVAAHEAGHVLLGMAAAFRPYLVVVGPLKLERTPDGWRMNVNRVSSWFGGFAAGLPRGAERLRQRLMLMIAGGPLASALAGIFGFWLYLLIRPAGDDIIIEGWSAFPMMACLGFAVLSLCLLILSLAPSEHQGFASDGARILRCMERGNAADAEVAVLTLCSASMAGQRPRDWDETLVMRAQQTEAASTSGVVGAYLAHWHALDRGDLATAHAHLATALEHRDTAPAMTRAALAIQAAKFHAAFAGDAAAAREWLAEATPIAAASDPQRLIAEAAIAVCVAAPNANDLIARAIEQLDRAQDRGCAAVDRELLERLRTELAAAAA